MTTGYELDLERAVRRVYALASERADYENTRHRMLFARHYRGDRIGLSSLRDLVMARIVRVLDHDIGNDAGMVY